MPDVTGVTSTDTCTLHGSLVKLILSLTAGFPGGPHDLMTEATAGVHEIRLSQMISQQVSRTDW